MTETDCCLTKCAAHPQHDHSFNTAVNLWCHLCCSLWVGGLQCVWYKSWGQSLLSVIVLCHLTISC